MQDANDEPTSSQVNGHHLDESQQPLGGGAPLETAAPEAMALDDQIEELTEVSRITFDELIEHGKAAGVETINGMPWSFEYNGQPVTHETDNCYLVGEHRFERGEFLVTLSNGSVIVPKPPTVTPTDAELTAAEAGGEDAGTDANWICTNCGTGNTRDEKKPFQKCQKCQELAPGETERIKAGIEAMGGGAATPDEIEDVARNEEGLKARKPRDRALPLNSKGGRFDFIDAFEELKRLSEVVDVCEEEYEELKEKTAAAKKRYESAQDTFKTRFDDLDELREKAERQPDLYEEQERKDALASSDCQIERSTGAPCPACQSQRAKGKPAEPSEPLHPAHPQHGEIAKALIVADRNELIAKLHEKNLYLELGELETVTAGELQALQRYANQRGPIPSEAAAELIKRSHRAATPGTERQDCQRCGMAIVDQSDLNEGVTFFPANAMVGIDCEGPIEEAKAPAAPAKPEEPAHAANTAAADEAPRKPKSHAKKDQTKKRDPEKHAKEQKAEGAQRAAKAGDKKAGAKKTGKAKSKK